MNNLIFLPFVVISILFSAQCVKTQGGVESKSLTNTSNTQTTQVSIPTREDFVGTWKINNKHDIYEEVDFEFHEDGTCKVVFVYGGNSTVFNGTWNYSEGKIKLGPILYYNGITFTFPNFPTDKDTIISDEVNQYTYQRQ